MSRDAGGMWMGSGWSGRLPDIFQMAGRCMRPREVPPKGRPPPAEDPRQLLPLTRPALGNLTKSPGWPPPQLSSSAEQQSKVTTGQLPQHPRQPTQRSPGVLFAFTLLSITESKPKGTPSDVRPAQLRCDAFRAPRPNNTRPASLGSARPVGLFSLLFPLFPFPILPFPFPIPHEAIIPEFVNSDVDRRLRWRWRRCPHSSWSSPLPCRSSWPRARR